ncbi:MAG: apolipoprotein N-acyltransferase [Nitrospinae bacterium]|nr:apolipoprotein N-acyltransferase [Nitrospinota bacterium]
MRSDKHFAPLPAAALSGALLILSFPPFGFHFLAWVALVPLMLSADGLKPAGIMACGLAAGLLFFGGSIFWVYNALHSFGGINPVVSVLLLMILILYLSLYFGLFGLVLSRLGTGPGLVVFAPPAFVGLEFVRGRLLTGFPWELLAHSQYKLPAMIQIASVTGSAGVTFLIVFVNAVVAHHLASRMRGAGVPVLLLAAVACVAANVVWGLAQIRGMEGEGGTKFKAALVQGNIEQDKKWDQRYREMIAQRYFDMTSEASAHRPDLIVWPEAAAPFAYVQGDTNYSRALTNAVRNAGSPLLFGAVTMEGRGERFYNSAYLLSTAGSEARYDKSHLVPFGEYVPLRGLIPFTKGLTAAIAGDTTPGRDAAPMRINGLSAGVQICYEIIFPEGARDFAAKGARIIVNITNDAWYGRTAASAQHMTSLPFRAVENRTPVLRAANTGISCFVDATGRIRSQTGLFTTTVLTDEVVVPPQRPTFYGRFGDLFTYCLLVTALVMYLVNPLAPPKD